MQIIDGKAIAARVRLEVAQAVKDVVARAGMAPGLAAVRGGDDPASVIYVGKKIRACAGAGRAWLGPLWPGAPPRARLVARVEQPTRAPRGHGFLVQPPRPRHISPDAILPLVAAA